MWPEITEAKYDLFGGHLLIGRKRACGLPPSLIIYAAFHFRSQLIISTGDLYGRGLERTDSKWLAPSDGECD